MLSRRLALVVGVLLCVVAGGLVLGGASAFALNERLFSGSFGGEGAGNGQFMEPSGVAVNTATHDVYVVDRGNGRVEQFTSAGAYVSQFDGSAAPSGAFSSPSAIAVDNSGNVLDPSAGDVYVVDTGHNVIDKFSSSGTYIGQLTETTGGASFGELDGVAVDANGVVWVYQGSSEIDSFSDALGNEYISQRLSPFGASPGFAVDSQDDLYVNRGARIFAKLSSSGEELNEAVNDEASTAAAVSLSSDEVFIDNVHSVGVYRSTGSFIERFGVEQGVEHLSGGSGIAVDPAGGTVYVADSITDTVAVFNPVVLADVTTGAASGVQPTSVTLNGAVNPDGVLVTSCMFEYGTDTSYGQSVACAQSPGSGTSPVAVSANLLGLQEGVTYHYRLVAGNSYGPNRGADEEVTMPTPPSIDSASAGNLSSGSVDLHAAIDPHAAQTSYRFEYGTSTAYGTGVPAPDGSIAAGLSDRTVTQHVTGLQMNTTYHWHVIARNVAGITTGTDHTFIYDTIEAGLPDNRAYEMVTPPQKNGALIGVVFAGTGIQLAENGSRVIAPSVQCFAGAEACNASRIIQGDPFAFTRTDGSWVASALAPPATQFDGNSPRRVSADAGTALFSAATPPAGEDDWVARQPNGPVVNIGPVTPPSAGALGQAAQEMRATANLSHVVYELSFEDLGRKDLWPFDATTTGGLTSSLYEYVGDGNAAPVLVGVSGGPGSTDLIGTCGITLYGDAPGDSFNYNPLSTDGDTVFFTVNACASGSGVNTGVPVPADALYARIDGSRTVLISGRSPLGCKSPVCLGSSPSKAEFLGASQDGSRAFFTSTQQLTDDASDGSQNLYEYDFSRSAGDNLVTVSAGDTSGGGPQVQGVEAISSDGSHVYFTAKGVLTGVANSQGQVAQGGAENLYVFERDANDPGGRVAFITALPASDREFTVRGDSEPGFVGGLGLANATPDGRFLVFMSHGRLTPDETSASGAAQVFRYDAQTGALARVSVGEHGFNDNGNAGLGDATIVPAGKGFSRAGSARPDPTMSHDGAFVFFESPVALTPRALNDVQVGTLRRGEERPQYAENVYEWHEGQVYLISDGKDTSALAPALENASPGEGQSSVALIGSDATGANVFFSTTDRLVGQDTDTQMDYYDARICTTSDPCIPAPPAVVAPCVGEGCRGVPGAPPSLAGPVSTSFSGAGNLAAETKAVVKVKKKSKSTRSAHSKKVKKKRMKGKRRAAGRHTKAKRSVGSTRRGR